MSENDEKNCKSDVILQTHHFEKVTGFYRRKLLKSIIWIISTIFTSNRWNTFFEYDFLILKNPSIYNHTKKKPSYHRSLGLNEILNFL